MTNLILIYSSAGVPACHGEPCKWQRPVHSNCIPLICRGPTETILPNLQGHMRASGSLCLMESTRIWKVAHTCTPPSLTGQIPCEEQPVSHGSLCGHWRWRAPRRAPRHFCERHPKAISNPAWHVPGRQLTSLCSLLPIFPILISCTLSNPSVCFCFFLTLK